MKLAKDTDSIYRNGFYTLVSQIQSPSIVLQQDTGLIINHSVTCRAWVTGQRW